MTRHHDVATARTSGLAAKAAATIADQQVRNRGTIGGTLAHGDPASDLPAVAAGARGLGRRSAASRRRARDRRRRPVPGLPHDLARPRARSSPRSASRRSTAGARATQKFNRRVEDWAMVAVCAAVRKARRRLVRGRADRPDQHGRRRRCGRRRPRRRCAASGARRAARSRAAAEQAAEGTDPPADLNATDGLQAPPRRACCAGARWRRRSPRRERPDPSRTSSEALAGEGYLADRAPGHRRVPRR